MNSYSLPISCIAFSIPESPVMRPQVVREKDKRPTHAYKNLQKTLRIAMATFLACRYIGIL
jgi:hypothetical protein